jgi:hypothetical protein
VSFSVRARGDAIATFRFVAVHLMETLGRWVPSTPELEAKVILGKHIWELAQHADAFGKRTHELRLGEQVSREPSGAFLAVLERVRGATSTGDRLDGFYAVMLPDMAQRYRDYLARTDALLDEPSVRVLERVLWDFERLGRDWDQLRARRPDLPGADAEWLARLRADARAEEIVRFRADTDAVASATG